MLSLSLSLSELLTCVICYIPLTKHRMHSTCRKQHAQGSSEAHRRSEPREPDTPQVIYHASVFLSNTTFLKSSTWLAQGENKIEAESARVITKEKKYLQCTCMKTWSHTSPPMHAYPLLHASRMRGQRCNMDSKSDCYPGMCCLARHCKVGKQF